MRQSMAKCPAWTEFSTMHNNQQQLWQTCVHPTESRHIDHRSGPPSGGQAEPADCWTQRSSAGPGRGLHWWDGPLWPGENPRESRARQGRRWALLALCSAASEGNLSWGTLRKTVSQSPCVIIELHLCSQECTCGFCFFCFCFFLLHSEFNPL